MNYKGGITMKSIFAILGFMLMLSSVFAATAQGIHEPGTGLDDPELKDENKGTGLGGGEPNLMNGSKEGLGEGVKTQLQTGEHLGEGGQKIMIQQGTNNQMRLEVNGESAKTSLNMNQEMVNGETRLSTKLSNGRTAEVKVMPDTASTKALEQLRLKTCSENSECSMELKEVGSGEGTKLAYELQTQRQSKILGLFKAQMQVQAQVDAENGEVLQVNKPWWAFIASEPTEE